MITLIELFDVAQFQLKDMETGELINSKVVLGHPDAIIEKIGFDWREMQFTVRCKKEPENE